MKCKNCQESCDNKMLHRTNPMGQTDGGWMCMDCIEKIHPELAINIKGDDDYQTLLDIEDAVRS